MYLWPGAIAGLLLCGSVQSCRSGSVMSGALGRLRVDQSRTVVCVAGANFWFDAFMFLSVHGSQNMLYPKEDFAARRDGERKLLYICRSCDNTEEVSMTDKSKPVYRNVIVHSETYVASHRCRFMHCLRGSAGGNYFWVSPR